MAFTRSLVPGLLALSAAVATQAADFDGSKPLICANVSAMDCTRATECVPGLPEDVGAPAFMRLDFEKRAVVGPALSAPILLMDRAEDQLILQGREGSFGWTLVLESQSGRYTVTLADRNGAFVWFGSCTPL